MYIVLYIAGFYFQRFLTIFRNNQKKKTLDFSNKIKGFLVEHRGVEPLTF